MMMCQVDSDTVRSKVGSAARSYITGQFRACPLDGPQCPSRDAVTYRTFHAKNVRWSESRARLEVRPRENVLLVMAVRYGRGPSRGQARKL